MPEMPLHPVARLLPPADWAERTPEFAKCSPDHSIVVVVEEGGAGGRILGKWGAITAVHVEGLEIIPEAQKHPAVAGALLNLMVTTLLNMGVPEVLTRALTPDVEGMIQTAGGRQLPGTGWVIPITPDGGG